MDISTTIIGLLVLTIFILPVILISRSGKSKKKQFEKDFFSQASMNELKISDKDFWSEYAIGIDSLNSKILYLDWSKPERSNVIFDLKDVKVFEPFPGFKEREKPNFNYNTTQRLGMKFSFKNPAVKSISIIFYFPGFGKMSDHDIRLFEKWTEIVRRNMDTKTINDLRNSA